MDCPTCGKKLPEGTIECPRCHPGRMPADARPIAPGAQQGLWLAGVFSFAVALAGGGAWAWYVAWSKQLSAFPAVFIGAAVGVVIRLFGGRSSPAAGALATLSTLAGMGLGAVLIYVQWTGSQKDLEAALQFYNFVFFIIGLSVARSLAGVKKQAMPPLLRGNNKPPAS